MSAGGPLRLPGRKSPLEAGGVALLWFHIGREKGNGERIRRRLACAENKNWIQLERQSTKPSLRASSMPALINYSILSSQ